MTSEDGKLDTGWLFKEHDKETLSYWAQHLNYFYVKRALGGPGYDMRQSPDGDAFEAAFTIKSEADLKDKINQLGHQLEQTTPDEYRQYKPLGNYGHCEIFGLSVYISIQTDCFIISVTGEGTRYSYRIAPHLFDKCLALEKQFDALGWQTERSFILEKDITYLSKARYPELFQ